MEVKYQVFVSSTFEDLKDERKEVCQAILDSHCIPAGMELFPASNESQWEFIKKIIDESDFYIVIVAGKYGSIGHDENGKKKSYTEMEFDYAVKCGKPIIALVHYNINELPREKVELSKNKNKMLEQFLKKIYEGRLIKKWKNKYELKTHVITALNHLKENTTSPGWIRADFSIEQLSLSHLEQQMERNRQQKELYENKIQSLNKDCTSLSHTISQQNAAIAKLNFKIAQLIQKLKDKGDEEIVKEEKAWFKITELAFSFKEHTAIQEKLVCDLSSSNEIPSSIIFFLKNYCSNEVLAKAIQKCEEMESLYKTFDICNQNKFLNNINLSYENNIGFDAYCMEDNVVIEILSYVFLLISLVVLSPSDLLKIKLTQTIYTLNKITYEIWETELCLSENDA